jgi:multidrug efflux pump subunit AcrA (membrane-fusion protein)
VFTGRVKSVAAVASQADWNSSDVKQFPTIVSIEDTDVFGLRPDMSAEVTIQVDNQKEKVLTVPIQAIVGTSEQGSTRKVYVMENGEPVEREVKLGTSNDRKAEVRSGLKEGEQVVLNPRAILGDKAKGVRDEGDASGRGAGKGKTGGQGKSGGGSAPPAAGGGSPSGKAKGAVQAP